MKELPTEPGFYFERTSGKYFRVFKSDSGSLLADEYGDDYRTLKWLTELPDGGNWQPLVPALTNGEAREELVKYLASINITMYAEVIADKAAEIFGRVPADDTYRKLYEHAIQCVDRVFQECTENPKPILPDFLGIGEDKFEGVVKLAEKCREQSDQITDLKATIARLEGEIAGVKRTTNEYREFDRVYDPECHLPELAAQVHADYIELLNRVEALKDQIKIRDASKAPPQPVVIEGQATPKIIAAVREVLDEIRHGTDVAFSQKNGTVTLRQSQLARLREYAEATFPPRATFTPPPKPEQVLIRYKGRDFYATQQPDGQWRDCLSSKNYRPDAVELIDETTGEVIQCK